MAHTLMFTVGPRAIEVEEDLEWGESPTGHWVIVDWTWSDPWDKRMWSYEQAEAKGQLIDTTRSVVLAKSNAFFDDAVVSYLSWIDGV